MSTKKINYRMAGVIAGRIADVAFAHHPAGAVAGSIPAGAARTYHD